MEVDEGTLPAFREALERLLASPEFSSSRQLQDFLRYTSELAFKGISQVEQVEIAEAVLGRNSSFNPVEDASVRKIASLTRQRLAQYYSRTGGLEDVVVTLPVRTYVPRYELRARESAPLSLPPPVRISRRLLRLVPVFVGIAAMAVLARWWTQRTQGEVETVFKIVTGKGDISSQGSDISPTGVQLGPLLRDFDEVSAVMRFTAAQENQQAGLLIWQDDDHYIQLGKRFLGRNQIAFTLEEGHGAGEQNVRYDAEGQSGKPIWLIVRKEGNRYRGLISFDGLHWDDAGPPLSPTRAFVKPRLGIYAFNGRRDAPATTAYFRSLSTGFTFSAWSGKPEAQLKAAGWHVKVPCPDSLLARFDPFALRLEFRPGSRFCNTEWSVPVPKSDWEYLTKLDFFTLPGVSAGLSLRGSSVDSLRLVRYELNGPSICLIHDGKTLVGKPDINGSPAVYLRLSNRNGVVTGAFSADGNQFHQLPGRTLLSDLGAHPEIGFRVTFKGAPYLEGQPEIRFAFLHQTVTALAPYR